MCHKTHAYWDISILKKKKRFGLLGLTKKKKSVSFFVVVIIIIIIIIIIALYLSVNVFSMKG